MTGATADEVRAALRRVYRDDGASVAWLTRTCGGDLGLAEDAFQEAATSALTRWEDDGIPDEPLAWLRTTARRKAIDRVRRQATGRRKHRLLESLERSEEVEPIPTDTATGDDQLTLIFTCCHPALGVNAQVALALKAVCGLSTSEIAHAFLVSEATMAQRIVRAKRKIAGAGIPFRIPPAPDMPDRLESVLGVVYLVFNEGHVATTGEDLVRLDLCEEAIRLARLLARLMPDEAEVVGLLALLLFHDSRSATRTDENGRLVRLADQDRTRWNGDEIREGAALLGEAIRSEDPGTYVVQASIAACHALAPTASDTDWDRIRALYDQLLQITGSPVVALNRVVAVSESEGPAPALAELDVLIDQAPQVDQWHRYHLTRAEVLRSAGDLEGARRAYDVALSLDPPPAERDHLERRAASLSP